MPTTPAARPWRDGGVDRLQSRLVAFYLDAADAQHGLHVVPPDARGSAGRCDPRGRPRARPGRRRGPAGSRQVVRPVHLGCRRTGAAGLSNRFQSVAPTHLEGRVTDRRLDNQRVVRAPRGTTLSAKSWLTEAPLRMLMNNLDPEVAERPGDLVVYGGIGKAARNWEC